MYIDSLNVINKQTTNWDCCVFDFSRINAGKIFIDYADFIDINVHPFTQCVFRIYRNTQKIVVSGDNIPDASFCGLDFVYSKWKCLICKKVSDVHCNQCFCQTYSSCWTPIKSEVRGLIFNDDNSFPYHFNREPLSTIVI